MPDDRGEWWLPEDQSGPLPTVVLVHGGFWQRGYDRHLEDRVAADLAARGRLVWNIDYRPARAGWPATLTDAAHAYDALRTGRAAQLVDVRDVVVAGHSAGGHLALWLASRSRLPAGAPGNAPADWIVPRLAVGQAPVAALTRAAEHRLGGGAAITLCGGPPDVVPERYAVADPLALLPAVCPVVLIHGDHDPVVPLDQSEIYAAAAGEEGAHVTLVRVRGGHFEHLDPTSDAGVALRSAIGAS